MPHNSSYYKRSTFPNMFIEEGGHFSQASFSNNAIYEWYSDGKPEHHILNTLQEMTMVSTDAINHAIAQTLATGFTGQLKCW